MGQEYNAVKEGAKEAIISILNDASDMPGQDIFHEIKDGVQETVKEWLDAHTKEIIETIAEINQKRQLTTRR